MRNVTAIAADGMLGWPTIYGIDQAPFDKIIVTAAARGEPPSALLSQLKISGVMVIPVGTEDGQVLRRYTKQSADTYAVKDLMGVRFVPLLPDLAKADEGNDDRGSGEDSNTVVQGDSNRGDSGQKKMILC